MLIISFRELIFTEPRIIGTPVKEQSMQLIMQVYDSLFGILYHAISNPF